MPLLLPPPQQQQRQFEITGFIPELQSCRILNSNYVRDPEVEVARKAAFAAGSKQEFPHRLCFAHKKRRSAGGLSLKPGGFQGKSVQEPGLAELDVKSVRGFAGQPASVASIKGYCTVSDCDPRTPFHWDEPAKVHPLGHLGV